MPLGVLTLMDQTLIRAWLEEKDYKYLIQDLPKAHVIVQSDGAYRCLILTIFGEKGREAFEFVLSSKGQLMSGNPC